MLVTCELQLELLQLMIIEADQVLECQQVDDDATRRLLPCARNCPQQSVTQLLGSACRKSKRIAFIVMIGRVQQAASGCSYPGALNRYQ